MALILTLTTTYVELGKKMRQKHSVIKNVRYRRLPRYNLEQLKQPDVAYAQNLEAALPDEDELNETPFEDC